MKKNKKILIPFISIILILFLSVQFDFKNDKAFDIISTFISITIGFSITALSIIATSPFSKKLYSIEYENDNSKSLLHILVNKFKNSTIVFFLCIVLIIIYKYFPDEENGINFLYFNSMKLLKSSIWFFSISSFVIFIDLFNTFSKFVIKSTTE